MRRATAFMRPAREAAAMLDAGVGLPTGEGDDIPVLIGILRMLEDMGGLPDYSTRPIGYDGAEEAAEAA
jgi:hypothetical protein